MASILKTVAVGSVVALALGGAAVMPAQAHDGGAVAAGVLGGLAAGAIVGSAVNANNGYYAAPAYAAPVYGAPAYAAPAYGGCYFTRQPVYDAYGYVVGNRRVRVCE